MALQEIPSIFNPSNDMALAANVRQYVPPKRIQQMETELAALARVWEGTRFAGPWGWSLAAKQRYRQMGVAETLLPPDAYLSELRRLSSRQFACGYTEDLLKEIRDERLLGSEMRWCDKNSIENLLSANVITMWGTSNSRCGAHRNADVGHTDSGLREAPHSLIFKSPWSSSGRGVFVSSEWDAHTQARLQGFLSSQGGFVADRFYADKVLDFAMEFFISEDHTVEFLGYSVFRAAGSGAYGYNYVESQQELLQRIDADAALLSKLIAYHQEHLSQLAYHGPVGIDMLKTADGSIHPCIEINLRMNMGILALLLHERYGSDATVALTSERAHGYMAKIEEGKLMIDFQK